MYITEVKTILKKPQHFLKFKFKRYMNKNNSIELLLPQSHSALNKSSLKGLVHIVGV